MSKERFQRFGGGVRALKAEAKLGQGDASRVCGWLPGRLGGGLRQEQPRQLLFLSKKNHTGIGGFFVHSLLYV
jgi:hypothetical protein